MEISPLDTVQTLPAASTISGADGMVVPFTDGGGADTVTAIVMVYGVVVVVVTYSAPESVIA